MPSVVGAPEGAPLAEAGPANDNCALRRSIAASIAAATSFCVSVFFMGGLIVNKWFAMV